jgi:beta-lactamase regulating signal transducer with metallopeptidase domain
MITDLANHIWQSSIFAAAIAVLAFVVRHNHARVRYRLWCAASVKFLVPFALLAALGSRADWAPVAQTQLSAAVAATVTQIHEPFSDIAYGPAPAASTAAGGGEGLWRPVLIAIWAFGVVVIVLMRLRMWWRVCQLVHASVPAECAGVDMPPSVQARSAPGMLEPAVVGIFRPILLLPAGIQKYLTPRQLHAVIAHELCHVRQRDNLTAAIHMLVEAVFWFHPLVWWIGRKLVDARERACDEDVLRQLGDPGAYAEGILKVCRRYAEASLVCVSGISGADLRMRVEAIAANRVGSRLKAAKACVLIVAGALAIALPVTVGAVAASQRTGEFLPAILNEVGLLAAATAPAPLAMHDSVTVVAPPRPRQMTSATQVQQQPSTPAPGSAARGPGTSPATPTAQQPSTPAPGSGPGAGTVQAPNVNPPVAYRISATATLGDRKFTGGVAVDPAVERRFEEALKPGNASNRLFLTADTSYRQLNRAEYQVAVTVRIAPGRELQGGERLRLEFVGVVQDVPYAITQAQVVQGLELVLDAEARDALATTPIVYETAFVLLPGRYRIRFLVRDQATDRIGAVDVPFFVPNLNRIKQ